MECPKCRAHNSDDAACCSLCFHPFKAKPASVATAGVSAAPPQSFRPAGEATVSYYGIFNITRGPYLMMQGVGFLFVFAVLIWVHSTTEASMKAWLPPDLPPEASPAKILQGIKFWFWLLLAYEGAETWYFLSEFSRKERAAG